MNQLEINFKLNFILPSTLFILVIVKENIASQSNYFAVYNNPVLVPATAKTQYANSVPTPNDIHAILHLSIVGVISPISLA